MNDKDRKMSCGCGRQECADWLRTSGLAVPGGNGKPDKRICCKCSMEGPYSELNVCLRDFRRDVIGNLDPIEDCHEIAMRFSKHLLTFGEFEADYADDFLDDIGKTFLNAAERKGGRDAFRYAEYLQFDFNVDDNDGVDEDELVRCRIHWLARSAADGYKRAIRELGWVAEGFYDCGNDFFDDVDSEGIPTDYIVSDCCFLSAALKGDPKAIQRYVDTRLIHSPRDGNEDYVLALQMMGPFANMKDVKDRGRSRYEEDEDRLAIRSLQSNIDYGLKESPKMSDLSKWHPWEHPFAVAICAENGWRIEKDITKAVKHYRIAAELGCKAAKEALVRLRNDAS